jgi:hypothetical protein
MSCALPLMSTWIATFESSGQFGPSAACANGIASPRVATAPAATIVRRRRMSTSSVSVHRPLRRNRTDNVAVA